MSPLDDVIRQLAKEIDARSRQDHAEEPANANSPLLKLPGEVRIRIYQYALWHEEGDGAICPVSKTCHTSAPANGTRAIVLKGGVCFLTHNGAPVAPTSPSNITDEECRVAIFAFKNTQVLWEVIHRMTPKHFCTFDCLRQPPLTKVYVQVRNETLPVFYGVNKFHFESSNGPPDTLDLFARWWRTIGDTNLGMIRRFNIHINRLSTDDAIGTGTVLRYHRPATGPSLTTKKRNTPVRGVLDTDEVLPIPSQPVNTPQHLREEQFRRLLV